MNYKKCLLYCILLVGIVVLVVGCDNQSQVKGIKERGKLEEEPEIVVKLPNGGSETMKLEKYIAGVVSGEMKNDWPENAYAAQAILARTFALKYMEENNTKTISSSYVEAQEYNPESISSTITDAVKKTRGQVVFYKDQYIKGWFHASAGGETTSAKVGLAYEKDEPGYVKIVKSPDQEAPDDVKNWKVEFSNKKIQETLSKMGSSVGQIREIKADKKDKTGRIIDIVFKGSEGEEKVKAANFRKNLDPKKLKSTKIDKIEKTKQGFKFNGSGFGHGVGMSQWGAYAMARDNKTAEDIIQHYYKDIEIAKVYD